MSKFKMFISFYTIFRRELVRILRIWPQSLLPPVITTGLYYVIFGKVMGMRIGNIDGISYIQYITPGLIMMSIMINAYTNVVFSFFSSKFQRNIEEMLVAPISNHVLLCGYISGGITRGILVGALVAVLSLFFSRLSVYSWCLTIFIVILASAFLSLTGFINGVFAKRFDDLSTVPMFVLTPLTYLGGIFYPVSILPKIWHTVTLVNPIFHIISGFRYAILGISDVSINYAIYILLIGTIALYSLCIWLLNKGIGLKS